MRDVKDSLADLARQHIRGIYGGFAQAALVQLERISRQVTPAMAAEALPVSRLAGAQAALAALLAACAPANATIPAPAGHAM